MPRRINRAGYSEADKLRRHQRILIDLGLLASQAMPLERFLRHAAAQVALAAEVTHSKILRYRPAEGDLLMVEGIGWHKGMVGQATFSTALSSAPGRALQTGEGVVIDDINASDEFVPSPTLLSHDIISLLNVPILIDHAAWGVLEVDHVERRDFRQDTADFLMAAARLIAIVIQRHQAEEAHREALSGAAIARQKREVMLAEIQHRMKNYFQMILSMIALERPKLPTEAGRELLGKISERILAISLANDQLSSEQERQVVAMPAYLRAICTPLSGQRDDVGITVKADELVLRSERAVPIALIVNELVTNSLKYAFEPGKGGTVLVELRAGTSDGRATLRVCDDGGGMADDAAPGTGTRLLHLLVRQVGGEVEQTSSTEGTQTTVVFIDGE